MRKFIKPEIEIISFSTESTMLGLLTESNLLDQIFDREVQIGNIKFEDLK